jgi:hypothetical protein
MEELLRKLQDSRFTGKLVLRLEGGAIESARLSHFIAKAEFASDIPLLHSGACQHGQCACHGGERQQDLF